MRNKKLLTYLAGPMESLSTNEMSVWRNEITDLLKLHDVLIYDPVAEEARKMGKDPDKQIEYIKGLKQGGHWSKFYDEMWRIWFGDIDQNTDIIQLLTHIRMKKHIEGDSDSLFKHMGDAEAVIRSDFIIVNVPKDVNMVGTIYEVMIAFLFRIPIYLILPDSNNTNTNSSLLFGTQISNNGKLKSFCKIKDCYSQICKDYKL